MFNKSAFISDPNSGLIARFKIDRPDQPIEINKIFPGFTDPANIREEELPAVFFGYGDTNRLQGGTSDGIRRRFSVPVYAVINKGQTDLIDRSGKMDILADIIAIEMRAMTPSDDIFLEDVYVERTLTSGGKLSDYEFMEILFAFVYQEYTQ